MQNSTIHRLTFFLSVCLLLVACVPKEESNDRLELAKTIEHSITTELLNKWYPAAMDKDYGGFLSAWTFDFKPTGDQDKMIVSQARHVWTSSKASEVYTDVLQYKECATHGFKFLRDVMWDNTYGGFHTIVDRQGNVKSGPTEEKTAYGNSFAIYALAAYYHATQDSSALNLAKKGFIWLEEHSHDPVYK